MNPVDYSAGMVPLQGRHDGAPGQSGGRAAVQYTTVNIPSELPKDHIIWSIFNFVWANFCCLGLVALINSVKARDRKMVGDLEGAKRYGSNARCLNIWVAVLASIAALIFIITLIVQMNRVYTYQSYSTYPRNNWGS